MWIRSQDKFRLIDVKAAYINYNRRNEILGDVGGDEGACYQLGTYATEERALQVMDDIQQFVIAKEKADLGGLNVHEVPRIYQMPET
jgi:hypothetical protein